MWYHTCVKYLFSAVFTKEKGGYSALCPELGVASQGLTIEQAQTNIKEAIELFIVDMSPVDLSSFVRTSTEAPILKTIEISHA
jgi:predicted RNase H-like HicB family nuclease